MKNTIPVLLTIVLVIAGCSTSTTPSNNNNNNNGNNNNGNPAVGIAGPSVGSTFVFFNTWTDTLHNYLTEPTADTLTVLANNVTFGNRTNVLKVLDKHYDPNTYPNLISFDTSYYGYDDGGNFFEYDTLYTGWYEFPTNASSNPSVRLGPHILLIGDTTWTITSAMTFSGADTLMAAKQLFQTLDVTGVTRSVYGTDQYFKTWYANSIMFPVRQRDSAIDYNAHGNEIGTTLVDKMLKAYSIK